MSKLCRVVAASVLVLTMGTSASYAEGPDISAQRLLESWRGEDPGMRMVAEVIASVFRQRVFVGRGSRRKARLLRSA
jgi:hypothetical protein